MPSLTENLIIESLERLEKIDFEGERTFIIGNETLSFWSKEMRNYAILKNWNCKLGSLTAYRNQPKMDETLPRLLILIGVDKILDQAGLADFLRCDLDIIWKEQMKNHFGSWINLMIDPNNFDNSPKEKIPLDNFLITLKKFTDLEKVSSWLMKIDLSDLSSYSMILNRLGQHTHQICSYWGNLIDQKSIKNAKKLLAESESILSRNRFLNDLNKSNAIRKLDKAIQDNEWDTYCKTKDSAIFFEPFQGDLLAAAITLRNFINDCSQEGDFAKIASCDILHINKLLSISKKEKKARETIRYFKGSPLEMLLSAIWSACCDFAGATPDNTDSMDIKRILKIEIIPQKYYHTHVSVGDEILTHAELAQIAFEQLHKVIGGIDQLITTEVSNCFSEINENCSIISNLEDKEQYQIEPKTTGQMKLFFKIQILDIQENNYSMNCCWRVAENDIYRLSVQLVDLAFSEMSREMQSGNRWAYLPEFHLPHYEEFFSSVDSDDTNIILMQSLADIPEKECFSSNLLDPYYNSTEDLYVETTLKKVSILYFRCLEKIVEEGLYHLISNQTNLLTELIAAYSEALKVYAENYSEWKSKRYYPQTLLSAFWICKPSNPNETLSHLESGLISILHPALMEMLMHQTVYLIGAFSSDISSLVDNDKIDKGLWRRSIEMGALQSPLPAIIYNGDQNISTEIQGNGLLYRIGVPRISESIASTRLLLSALEDDEVSNNTELVKTTSESNLITSLLRDYVKYNPNSFDGLSISIFNSTNLQAIIAGIHGFLAAQALADRNFLDESRLVRPFIINLHFYSFASEETGFETLIQQWSQFWDEGSGINTHDFYRKCQITISSRLISDNTTTVSNDSILDNLEKQIEPADIILFFDFLKMKSNVVNKFQLVEIFDGSRTAYCFPVLEKLAVVKKVFNDMTLPKRSRIYCNRQFSVYRSFFRFLYAIKNQRRIDEKWDVNIESIINIEKWQLILKKIQKKADWLICIDPNMDRYILKSEKNYESKELTLIGSATGVGTHAEENYTVSSYLPNQNRLIIGLIEGFKQLFFVKIEKNDYEKLIINLCSQNEKMADLSLIKAALSGTYYNHDFFARSLARKILKDSSVDCDILISLDAMKHWFLNKKDDSRADVVWMRVKLNDDRFDLNFRVIELKVGDPVLNYAEKAFEQASSTTRYLMEVFEPGQKTIKRPDKRFWWMQLYRLIASNMEVEEAETRNVSMALERLSEGDFTCYWDYGAFLFESNPISNCPLGYRRIQDTSNTWDSNLFYAYEFSPEFSVKIGLECDSSIPDWKDLQEFFTIDFSCYLQKGVYLNTGIYENSNYLDSDKYYDDDLVANDDLIIENEDSNNNEDTSVSDNLESDSFDFLNWNVDPNCFNRNTNLENTNSTIDENLENVEIGLGQKNENNQVENFKDENILLGKKIIKKGKDGVILEYGKEVYWEFENTNLNNRHLLILGSSGGGKTYAIEGLLGELSRNKKHCLVIDYTQGFKKGMLEPEILPYFAEQQSVMVKPLQINPFKQSIIELEPGQLIPENTFDAAKRIASVFKQVWSETGTTQIQVLINALEEGITTYKNDFSPQHLLELLEGYAEKKSYKSAAETYALKIRSFVRSNIFSIDNTESNSWDDIFSSLDYKIKTFQFAGVDSETSRLAINFILWDMYNQVSISTNANQKNAKVVVCDEVQNLSFSDDSPLTKLLAEGRKFGFSIICATQNLQRLGGLNSPAMSSLMNAGTQLIFGPPPNEITLYAKLLYQKNSSISEKEWQNKLAQLRRGECYACTIGKIPQLIKISSMSERGL
jgi:DNA phosphorothioation-dependent restriction protein DptH